MSLSKPSNFKDLRHREKLLRLREQHGTGIYAACNKCDKWRFLEAADPLDLPKKWYCKMNPDPKFNCCTVPEHSSSILVDDDVIINEYTAGSLVWVRFHKYPWWPAIVEDDPDTEQYYWLENTSHIPTYYHVMFFDGPNQRTTRGWVTPKRIKPFSKNFNMRNTKNFIQFRSRILHAKKIAKNASKLTIKERLREYGLLAYSNLEIHAPISTPNTSDDEGDGGLANEKQICMFTLENKGQDKLTKNDDSKQLETDENIKKRHNRIVTHSFENEQSKSIKKPLQESVIQQKIKKRRNTIATQSLEDYEETYNSDTNSVPWFKNLERTDIEQRSQVALEKTSTITQNNYLQNCSNIFTITNDSRNMYDAFDLPQENDSLETETPKRLKTYLNSNYLNNTRYDDFVLNPSLVGDKVGGTTNGVNKKNLKNRKGKNCNLENSKVNEKFSFNQSDSKFNDKMKLLYKEIFDEDSNSVLQMTDNKKKMLDVIETVPKQETFKKANKSLWNKGFVWPSNFLNSVIPNSSTSLTSFNFGELKTTDSYVDNSITRFDLNSASQNKKTSWVQQDWVPGTSAS